MFNRTSNGHSKESKAVVPAGVPQDDLLWSSMPPSIISELDTPIDPALVSQRKGRGGKKFSYIEGHTVIDEANRVFGYGGWGYDVVGDVTLREIDNVDTETGEVRRIRAYAATVRVTVPGAPPRSDIGFHAVVEDNADGHETAIKGAVTDGLKRALRTFGARFGNALYGDPQTGIVEVTKGKTVVPDAETEKLKARLLELADKQGFDAEQVEAAVKGRTGRSIDQLANEELADLVAAAEKKVGELEKQVEPPPAA